MHALYHETAHARHAIGQRARKKGAHLASDGPWFNVASGPSAATACCDLGSRASNICRACPTSFCDFERHPGDSNIDEPMTLHRNRVHKVTIFQDSYDCAFERRLILRRRLASSCSYSFPCPPCDDLTSCTSDKCAQSSRRLTWCDRRYASLRRPSSNADILTDHPHPFLEQPFAPFRSMLKSCEEIENTLCLIDSHRSVLFGP